MEQMTPNSQLVVALTKVLADLLSALAWPVAILIVALMFRTQIKQLFTRMRGFTGFGTSVDLEPNYAVEDQGAAIDSSSAIISFSGGQHGLPSPDVRFEDMDALLLGGLQSEFPDDLEAQLKWAIRFRSVTEYNRGHEQCFRLIFGSQIWLLRFLNNIPEIKKDEVKSFYYERIAVDPKNAEFLSDRDFESWLQFLVNMKCVEVEGEGSEASVKLTTTGRDFLVWMLMERVSDSKPG
jgi:hypothetical protein